MTRDVRLFCFMFDRYLSRQFVILVICLVEKKKNWGLN